MLYFANPSVVAEPYMRRGLLGYIDTPRQGNKRPRVRWCADNGVFSKKRALAGEPWNATEWWTWLSGQTADADLCTFAVIPDVLHWVPTPDGRDVFPVGDHVATAQLARRWVAPMRALGFPLAYVLQDGCTSAEVPWDDIAAVFIGGSDDWKVGPAGVDMDGAPRSDDIPVLDLVAEAHKRGKWVHMGRVNSRKRFRFAAEWLEVDSVDGTYLTFAPRQNVHWVMSWIHAHHGRHVVAAAHERAARLERSRAAAARLARV